MPFVYLEYTVHTILVEICLQRNVKSLQKPIKNMENE